MTNSESVRIDIDSVPFVTPYWIGRRVMIDNHEDMIGIVQRIQFGDCNSHEVELGWIHNGEAHSGWFPSYRLTPLYNNNKAS